MAESALRYPLAVADLDAVDLVGSVRGA